MDPVEAQMVEYNLTDVAVLQETRISVGLAYPIHIVPDSLEAMEYLRGIHGGLPARRGRNGRLTR